MGGRGQPASTAFFPVFLIPRSARTALTLPTMIRWSDNTIHPDPLDMLWHYANGQIPCYLDDTTSEVGWVKYTHRGVQFLDNIQFPRKEKRYIFHPSFQVRFDQRFEEVVRHCATAHKDGRTWITPPLLEGYLALHRLGFAHSYEAWQEDELVGGGFGIQIGGFITCESLFHRVSSASKAAWGQTLLYLRQRGFGWVDTNCVASHRVQYGEQWVPQWKFETMLARAMQEPVRFCDDQPSPALPWQIRLALPVARLAQGLKGRWQRRPASAASA